MYLKELECSSPCVALDDLILTTNTPTTAGSKMLENYESLFEAEVVTRLKQAGYSVKGKINVGEFGVDLLGETSYFGAVVDGDNLVGATSKVMSDVDAVIGLDVNGEQRRSASLFSFCNLKPTYGTVSRYGTIPVVCSAETVSITGKCPNCVEKAYRAVVGHDDKDGTSHRVESLDKLDQAKEIKKVGVLTAFLDKADESVKDKVQKAIDMLKNNGVEVVEIEDETLLLAKNAWNILMSAELCNNLSRYDGIKYGYRTPNYKTIDELYTNSRSESFGEFIKHVILFGSETLSTENYMKVYDKALRVRRVMVEKFAELFQSVDAVLLPATSKSEYKIDEVKANKFIAFEENLFTAPASITGLPTVTVKGVQVVAPAFSDYKLLDLARKVR
ncbi:MAG: hypothetical protein IJF76_01425 [Clostridia bacterium]|nr:hypothetical protein [Clostridia bacterium]